MPEERYIEGTEYTVTDDGKVFTHKRGISGELKQYRINGRARVILIIHKKKVPQYVHRLVAEAFIPNPDKLPYVQHKNKNCLDNRAENLFWSSFSDRALNSERRDFGNCERCGAKLKSNRKICPECISREKLEERREKYRQKRVWQLAGVNREKLNPKQKAIYDGYLREDCPTYQEIGTELGVTRQYIEQQIRIFEKMSQTDDIQKAEKEWKEAQQREKIMQKERRILIRKIQAATAQRDKKQQEINLLQEQLKAVEGCAQL